ncbi:MAG: AAA family ATPase [Candidatus Omnitrophota bacterium]
MDIQFEQLKKLNTFLSCFFPNEEFDKIVLNAATADRMIFFLASAMDALIKGENLYKKRNMMIPENHSFFTREPFDLLSHINLYFYRFDSRIFNFNRTERQTFIFILENVLDYLKRMNTYADNQELFRDYRFWIENLFKMANQKIVGTIYSSQKLNLKNVFTPGDPIHTELIYSNTSVSFSISPFVFQRENRNWFLTRVDKDDGTLIYTEAETGEEIILENAKCDLKIFEFLISNLDFETAGALKPKLKDQHSLLLENCDLIENACNYHKERLFQESFSLLKDISLETLDLPLVHLLQIKNLLNTNRTFEVKKLMQKFLTLYPYYAEGYEIMGDIYLKEEDFESAVNFYEKVIQLTQNKRVMEKLKRIRETIEKNKQQSAKERNENFFDLTDQIFHGDEKLLPREKELRQMIEILISESKRNVLLVGESGVGKSALIRLLGMKILNNEVPPALKEKRLKEINFVSLLTGSKYRGQFEEKVLKVLGDFQSMKSILILEDVHLMIATGIPRGTSMDFINLLKPFLRDKSIQVIATTNYEEMKNVIEKDNPLMGFFQKITVSEMSVDETHRVLKKAAEDIFTREKIMVSDDIIGQVIEIAKRDSREKKCPDSALMILERSVAKLKYKMHLDDLTKNAIEATDVAEVTADMLNLPETSMPLSLKQRLIGLKDRLLTRIIGQEEAIERIAATMITAKLKFDVKKGRPDGVFLFIGPTGVGKTETAIALARTLYGSEDYLIRIDMSEYMEKHTYSRFVGAAPGYVGYMDTNQLTDKVRQNPFSIILLDEIEKADAQLLNIFLQVFDAGRLTDARGNVIDFSHATIIMTSNIGTSLFAKTTMGYQHTPGEADVSHTALMKSLKKYFSPEFLNRVDDVLIFSHLKEDHIKTIIDLQLALTRDNLRQQGKTLILQDEVIALMIANGYSKEYGARHLGRVLRKHLLEKIAHLSLEKEWDHAHRVICSLDEQQQVRVQLEPDPLYLDPLAASDFIDEIAMRQNEG